MRGMCVKVRAAGARVCPVRAWVQKAAALARARWCESSSFYSAKGPELRERERHTHTSSVFRQPANSAAAGEH